MTMSRSPAIWSPALPEGGGPLYLRLAAALERDIAAGRLGPGQRLPPQRDLAYRLGVGIGTVTKAYLEAEARGLIEAHVGRGSFVRNRRGAGRTAGEPPADLARNIAPLAPAERRLPETLARLRRRADLMEHLGYAPPLGVEAHRRAAAAWLERSSATGRLDWRRLMVCGGAQEAISLALAMLARPGETVMAEAASFIGIKSAAEEAGLSLLGLRMDRQGVLPEALDEAAAAGARLVYLMPTLQNPTGRTMGAERRAEIVRIARARDLLILEDDIYAPLAEGVRPAALAALAPERTFYLTSLSKAVAPGLRAGFLVAPRPEDLDAAVPVVRARCYAPAAIGPLIAAVWMEEGIADEIAAEVRQEIGARAAMARAVLAGALEPAAAGPAPHLWLPMPELQAERLAARVARDGVEVTPPSAPIVEPQLIQGVRLCLGAVREREMLQAALESVAAALAAGTRPSDGLV